VTAPKQLFSRLSTAPVYKYLALAGTGRMYGTVTAGGSAAPGRVVKLYERGGGAPIRTVLTDASGNYAFEYLDIGYSFVLVAFDAAGGYAPRVHDNLIPSVSGLTRNVTFDGSTPYDTITTGGFVHAAVVNNQRLLWNLPTLDTSSLFYGTARITGILPVYSSPIAAPVPRVVKLYERNGGSLVRTVISDTAGNYAFERLTTGYRFFVVARNDVIGYDAVIADNLLASGATVRDLSVSGTSGQSKPWLVPVYKYLSFSGTKRIAGTVAIYGTPTNTPVSRLVRLYERGGGTLARWAISDASGNYAFEYLDGSYRYLVTALDGLTGYDAVIHDNITPT
jgi:hypothetical protein